MPARPGVPAHAGTLDVDIVIDLEMLVRTDAYRSLESNLRKMGFAPVRGKTWRWQTQSEDGDGVATEKVRFADVVSFTCLKAFAFEQRFERKDAHDLIYCIEHASEELDAVCEAFREVRAGKHRKVVDAALQILRERFASDAATKGHRKDGPVAVAKFELGENVTSEARLLRQRQAADLVECLLAEIE